MQIEPIRIQRSRKVKQVSPNGLPIVYVGRPGRWGNPFSVQEARHLRAMIEGLDTPKGHSREVAVRKYESYLHNTPGLVAAVKEHLKGKNLSCWCALDKKCHADILLKIANE